MEIRQGGRDARLAPARRVVAILGTIAVLASCAPSEERGPQEILGWSVDDTGLHLTVDTCNGDPETTVEETGQDVTVTVTVVSTRRNRGDECLDSVEVTLRAPLGDRILLDGSTGREPEPYEG